ncbi:7-carboxy-7-deazaguanine synthase QueE [Psychrobacter sp. AOP22-C1-22]|uniref:7-carboxy-7-deazaguanine synthase QueE n=1 Tax=unclassified Psychrobacter TaxID=196806 RepID=UPI00178895CA|nr:MULTISPECIES: 7-carboxy-7-deazaguanine synthase QueE [unclassified Psychrobacter]MBE0405553.1 7-carboxy-7-deazaguanine synthase QueE [Psychrobacter sp. FME6]MBE0444544.1 7-carboxy-7-deazaguanine synthase QueE [Psychrobacter sp. FME5]MDN5801534.1 7-carboxy-7-deazaguanine synthase QueE [Psychrobacter sp.]MDN5891157.1 7-carboxy-7-deazaguanine synthase QueE [Psychrobacter sp.]
MSELSLRSAAIPVTDPEAGLRLTEIFYSLQGEALTSGLPTIFVRLTGCPLRCVYCDTEYAFSGGERQSLETIMATIASFPCKRICLTGGEPLAQPNAIELMKRLLNDGYEISLETAGALTVENVPTAVSKVMDLKTPSSGEADKNLWSNLDYLTQHDQIKFVIMNREDYDWSKTKLIEHNLNELVGTVWFSPMFNVADDIDADASKEMSISDVPVLARELAEWILADALPVRFQLQLHKIIWADAKGK